MSALLDPLPPSALQATVAPPTSYIVGQRRTGPLLHARHLNGHLALLHAFDTLRRDVEYGDLSRFPLDARTMGAETRWAWFVNLAVERFQRWCTSMRDVLPSTIEKTLPPLDVIMVWHTYLLNPIWYAEDTTRVQSLSSLPRYTAYLTSHLESPELLLTNHPDPHRVQFWQEQTKTLYDPLNSAGVLTNITLCCPRCLSWMEVPILASDGQGYAQAEFAATCSSCKGRVTKELLGLRKFAADIIKQERDGSGSFLAGTLHSRELIRDVQRASRIKKRVQSKIKSYSGRSSTSHCPVFARDIMLEFNYDPSNLSKKLKGLLPRIANRILHAYSDGRPFSVELASAVLRQGLFVRKMAELGWTQPSFFSENDGKIILEHCVTRYHAFLNLLASSPGSFFVPTLDIDLAWHTHQLMANTYQKDCISVVGRYVDHDDKVEEGHLATSFDLTCRAWIDRYKVPYTHCGCPQPGATLSQRLRYAFRNNESADMTLLPPNTATSGTHASDHNAVFPMNRHKWSMHAREQRQEKSERRKLREVHEAVEALSNTDVRRARDCDHAEPFLLPVPLHCVPPGGCVAAVAGVVDGGASFFGAQCAAGIGGRCGFGTVGCGMSTCGIGTGSACGGGGNCGGGGDDGGASGGNGGGCGGGGCGGGCGGGGCGGS